MGKSSYRKYLCLKCQKTNACSCNYNDPLTKIDMKGSWIIPGPNAKKNSWKAFLKSAKGNFKRHYILSESLVTKNAILHLYTKYVMAEILQKAIAQEESNIALNDGEGQQSLNPVAEMVIAIDEEAIARMGGGLYLKLKFELARLNDGYPELILKVLHGKEIQVVKIYKQLQRKLKKITGYEFNLRTTGDNTKDYRSSYTRTPELTPRWTAEFKLPKALQKINGDKKVCLRKQGEIRFDYIGDFK